MTTFDKREKAAENKFTHDAELQFKISSRRNSMAALWAAEKMAMDPQAAKDYAKKLVAETIINDAPDIIIQKIHADFVANGLDITDEAISTLLTDVEIIARRQIMTE